MSISAKQHWNNIYQSKDTKHKVSWYQTRPKTSIDLILSMETDKNKSVIDVGGGDSLLVDNLLDIGFKKLSVLDISSNAIQKAKKDLVKRLN